MSHIPARPEQIQSSHSSKEFAHARAVVASTLELAYARAYDPTNAISTESIAGFIDLELDGLGGAIMRVLRDLSRFELAFVLASCGPRSFGRQPTGRARWPWLKNDVWYSAVNLIVLFAPGVERKKHRETNLSRWLTERHFGADHKCSGIAEMVGVHGRTVERYSRAISKLLGTQEHLIWAHLTGCLRDIGALDGTAGYTEYAQSAA